MPNQKIIFKYTSKGRVEMFFIGLDSIVNNLEDKENYHILCTFDLDDSIMNNSEVINRLCGYDKLTFYFGVSHSKISAINNDLDKLPKDWGILVNMSNDMEFTKFGFDNIIRKAFDDYFPNGDGFVHFHDGNQNRLSTMSIIDKKHFSRFNYIYHPDFKSVYVDNFHQDYAIKHGCYKYLGDDVRLIEHKHPLHNRQYKMDEGYIYTEQFYPVDRETYLRLKKEFGL